MTKEEAMKKDSENQGIATKLAKEMAEEAKKDLASLQNGSLGRNESTNSDSIDVSAGLQRPASMPRI